MDRKRLIMLGAPLVLLLAAGGGWFALGALNQEEVESAIPETPPGYLEIKMLDMPVVEGGRVSYYIYLDVVVEVEDHAAAREHFAKIPNLRDAFVRDLYRAARDSGAEGAHDLPLIKERLKARADDILGPGVVVGLLVTRTVRGPSH